SRDCEGVSATWSGDVGALARKTRPVRSSLASGPSKAATSEAILADWGCDYLQGALVGLASPQRPWPRCRRRPPGVIISSKTMVVARCRFSPGSRASRIQRQQLAPDAADVEQTWKRLPIPMTNEATDVVLRLGAQVVDSVLNKRFHCGV